MILFFYQKKEFSLYVCGDIFSIAEKNPPTVFPLVPCSGAASTITEVTIGCLSTDYLPAGVDVTWNSGSITTGIKKLPDILRANGVYMSTSLLTISASDWKSKKYTCHVNHKGTSKTIDKNVPVASSSPTRTITEKCKCPEVSTLHPKIIILPASTKDLHTAKETHVTCVVSRLKSTGSLNIKWKRSDGKNAEGVTSQSPQNSDGTYTVKSILKISNSDWENKVSFSCTTEHPELPKPIEKSIKREDGLREPTIYIFPPPTAELSLQKDGLVGVICLFKGFNHADIYVEWRKNNVTIGEDNYQNTEPILDSHDNETYIMFSRVLVHKSNWNRGSTFACHGGFRNILSKEIRKNEDIIWENDSEEDKDSLWYTAATFIILFIVNIFYNVAITIIKVK